MIRIVAQVLPTYIGDNVKLECTTDSFPVADHIVINYKFIYLKLI